MADILLSTINATYQHASFGLRYLYANLGELRPRAELLEFVSSQKASDMAEAILAREPKVVGFGVYIWNANLTREVVTILKKVAPPLVVVVGGPEVSYENRDQILCQKADFVFEGESDLLFRSFCDDYLSHHRLPETKWVKGILPDLKQLESPYPWYTEEDIRNRFLYVEASRGCPYKCEFCLSSLDTSVRAFDLEPFLLDMDRLIERGARAFKFVDRTFNLNISTSKRILEFFLARVAKGLFLHFELVPDRLPSELKELIARFPEGSLQFEIGIQTWNPEVSKLISRRQDLTRTEANLTFLREKTSVHVHADLIVGLPGETLESFAEGFDRLYVLGPSEIQVGILKRLKGTPIIRHDSEWRMVYDEAPPFQVLSTRTMPFETVQRMVRFAKFWDLYANSGNFKSTWRFLNELAARRSSPSLFWQFWEFSKFLNERHPQRYAIALVNLVESLWIYLKAQGCGEMELREALIQDYCGSVKRDVPKFLREEGEPHLRQTRKTVMLNRRQARHQAGNNPLFQ